MAKERKKSTLIKDFKDFIMRGNVVDMAVGVIIGAAFGKIITSLVNDIIMPIISLIWGGGGFSDLKVVLKPAELDAAGNVLVAANEWRYGNFIQVILDFLIIALCIFLFVRLITKLREKGEALKAARLAKSEPAQAEEAEPAVAEEPASAEASVVDEEIKAILIEMRDLMKKEQTTTAKKDKE